MKVVKKINLNEIYEIDGGFFYIEKQEIKDEMNRKYSRYFLKTSVTPKKMDLLKSVLNGKVIN